MRDKASQLALHNPERVTLNPKALHSYMTQSKIFRLRLWENASMKEQNYRWNLYPFYLQGLFYSIDGHHCWKERQKPTWIRDWRSFNSLDSWMTCCLSFCSLSCADCRASSATASSSFASSAFCFATYARSAWTKHQMCIPRSALLNSYSFLNGHQIEPGSIYSIARLHWPH